MITFIQILDSDINQLTSMRGLAFENFQTQYYHSVLLNYLTGNDFELLNNQHELERLIKINPELFILLQVVKLRYLIRTYQVTEETMKEFSNLSHIPSQWLGEYLFVLSSAASTLHAHKLSIEYSLQAFHELKRLGAKKKAVRALTNAIASESCIRPEKHYLSDLLYAYREAKAIQDFPTIANTLLNLSREYQRLSLFAMATKYANRALALYSKHNHGGLDHLLGLCHRAYLYAQIEAYKEAQQDIEAAMGSPFLEVKSAIAIMLEKFPRIKISYQPENNMNSLSTTTTWIDRKSESLPEPRTKLEVQLLNLLIQRPQTKTELCSALYGNKIESDVGANRLNNLLNRVRKQNPGLITFRENKYFLSTDIYTTELTNKILSS